MRERAFLNSIWHHLTNSLVGLRNTYFTLEIYEHRKIIRTVESDNISCSGIWTKGSILFVQRESAGGFVWRGCIVTILLAFILSSHSYRLYYFLRWSPLFPSCVFFIFCKSNKNQLDATMCRFYFCRVTLHVSGASAHHQEYLKLVQRPLVPVFCKIYNILTLTC